jgi:glycosyltransferase involved in cell wall biosynthesis
MKKNKKIVHFHPSEKYAAIFVGPLMDAEKKNGYDTRLITSDEANLIASCVIPYDLRAKNFFYLFSSFNKILRTLTEFKPDIVISHNSRSSLVPLFVSWLKSIPKRIYFNHGVPYIGYTGIARFILVILERMNCYFSTKVITVSSDMEYLLLDVAPNINVELINFGSACGINLKDFYPKQNSKWPFRDANQIKSNDFLTVYIGRPNKRKGFKECLNLWAKHFQNTEYKLVLCGISEANVLSSLSCFPKNVICVGFTDQIPQLLREADCLLLPSFHEGFSYAALEALASGCLVLANNVDGIRNLITNKVNGILVDNNDLNIYKEYIQLMRSEPEKFLDMKSEGFIQAKKFSRDNFLDSYLSKIDKFCWQK